MSAGGRSLGPKLTRTDFEEEFVRARAEKRVPQLTGDARGADLRGLNFTSEYESGTGYTGPYGGIYSGIDFRQATLENCDFERCDLSEANLRTTNLSGSNLRWANLNDVRFESALLDYVDLTGSSLFSTEFRATGMRGTVLRNALVGATSFISTDLSKAVDLGTTLHHLPSAIDTDSLRFTCDGLDSQPDYVREDFFRFLSLSGMDDDLATVVRNWIGRPIEYYSVFISHSSLDKEFARKLYLDLQAIGVKCWLDEREILPGDSILDSVDKGIKVHDRLILVCSENSLGPNTGWWVEEEIERGLAKERELRRAGQRIGVIIPITLDQYVFTEWASSFRATILEKNVGDFQRHRDTQSYASSLQRLVSVLNRDRQA